MQGVGRITRLHSLSTHNRDRKRKRKRERRYSSQDGPLTCCQNWASRYMRSFLNSQSMDCMAWMSSELASAEACMLASAGVFRLARTGCWSTDALLLASRFAWYTAGTSSELPVASSWAPIGAEGPWRPSDEATLTASSFSAGPKTVPLRVPAPPTPPGAHASAGGPVATVSSCSLVSDTVPDTHTTRRRTTHSAHGHTKSHVSVFTSVFTRVIGFARAGSSRSGEVTPDTSCCCRRISWDSWTGPASGCRRLCQRHHTHTRADEKKPRRQRCTARGHTSLALRRSFSLASFLWLTSGTEREYETRPSRLLTWN